MKTIEERAKDWSHIDDYTEDILAVNAYNAYIAGAKEQKAIDEEIRLQKCDDMIQAEYDRKIEERAKDYAYIDWSHIDDYTEDILAVNAYNAYIEGAKEQKSIDEEMRLKKSDDMTQEEYDREVAFADWYHQNGKGTPTYSDAIEWARKVLLDDVCNELSNYFAFEHEAMSEAGCDAFLHKLRNKLE